MKRRRVALMLPSLDPSGLVRVVVNLTKGLTNRDFEVDLVVPEIKGAFADDVPNVVKVVSLNGADQYSATWLPSLVFYFRRANPDWVIVPANHGSLATLAARRLANVGTKICVTIHTHFPSYFDRLHPLQAQVLAMGLGLSVREADKVISVSQGAAQGLSEVTELATHNIEVAPNPVVSDDLLDLAAKPVNHPWITSDDREVIVFIGRLLEHKGIPTLLRALNHVRESRKVGLILVGEGPCRKTLEQLVVELDLENAVDFLGFVDNPYPLLQGADVFAFSSVGNEGLPSVIIEAMACGCPIVATDCDSGPREILEDGKYGEIVPPCDPSAMASAIDQILSSPPDPTLLKERASDFSVEQATTEYQKILNLY